MPSHASALAPSRATPERPWLGLAHFTEAERDYFYGRGAEIQELAGRVGRAPLTVLYGISGYGKSSLLGAGLIPALREGGHRVTLLRRCYDELESRPLSAEVIDSVRAEWDLEPRAEEEGGEGAAEPNPSLWEFFHDRRRPWLREPGEGGLEDEGGGDDEDAAGTPPAPPVLILDQFEEIFIRGEDRASGDAAGDARAREHARDFLAQLAELVENRPPEALRRRLESGTPAEKRALLRRYDFQARPVRVAVALRDDFLARLERWRRAMPSMMEHRLELRLLSGPQAYLAVHEPGAKRPGRPPIIPAEVAEAVVRSAAGAAPGTPLEEIDAVPPILSLLCERLNERRLAASPPPESVAEGDFSPEEASRILGDFYEERLRPHPAALREFLEDKLVSDSGFRENVTLDAALAALRGRVPDARERLRRLVDDRILAIEERGGAPRVELTHDTLARLALERRAEREARRRRRRALAWAGASLAVAAVSLALAGWALKERAAAEGARAEAEEAKRAAEVAKSEAETSRLETDRQLAETRRQLEKSQLEEGRAWFERAKVAWEGRKAPFTALMLAGRAMGYRGFGRSEAEGAETAEFDSEIPDLLSKPMEDRSNEEVRKREAEAVMEFARSIQAIGLPIWSSPVRAHHYGQVNCVAYSPDGATLASGSEDGAVKLWDAATGLEIGALPGHSARVICVALSPEGSLLASSASDHTVKLWDLATRTEIFSLEGHSAPVGSVAFSPGGRLLASLDTAGVVKLWDAGTGVEVATPGVNSSPVFCVAFSPDGERLASAAFGGEVKLWDVRTGEELRTIEGHSAAVTSVAFSADGSRFATGSADAKVRIWDAASFDEVADFDAGPQTVTGVAFSPDGEFLAVGSLDGIVRLLDPATGVESDPSRRFSGAVGSVVFSPDGKRLASGSEDDTLAIWDAASGLAIAAPEGHSGQVRSVAFSPDGTKFASGGEDSAVKLWDAITGEEAAAFEAHSNAVTSVAFSPDGTRLASGSLDGSARLWSVATGEELAVFEERQGSVFCVAFSPDGRRVASGFADGTVKLWDADSGTEVATLEADGHSGEVNCVAFSPDGLQLASGSAGRIVKLWDVESRKVIADHKKHRWSVTDVSFSPDGSLLASSSLDGFVMLWDLATRAVVKSLEGHTGGVSSLAFSPEGGRLASASSDRSVKLWDLTTGAELATLEAHSGFVMSVAFSPDGSRLASGHYDSTVKIWDVRGAGLGESAGSFGNAARGASSGAGIPDMEYYLSEGWYRFEDREIVPATNPSLLSSKTFAMRHLSDDELAALSEPGLSSAEAAALRLSLMARTMQWRAARAWWMAEGEGALPGLRADYLKLMIAAYADPKATAAPGALEELATETAAVLAVGLDLNPRSSLALSDHLFLLGREVDRIPDPLWDTFVTSAASKMPLAWTEQVARRALEIRAEEAPEAVLNRLVHAVRSFAATRPESVPLQRLALATREPSDSQRHAEEDRLLALREATAGDFIGAGYEAAKRGDSDRAREVFGKAKSRFPDAESIHRMEGWALIGLDDPAAALGAFQAAANLASNDGALGARHLVGLALALWLSDREDDAVATYRQIVEAGRTQDDPKAWDGSGTGPDAAGFDRQLTVTERDIEKPANLVSDGTDGTGGTGGTDGTEGAGLEAERGPRQTAEAEAGRAAEDGKNWADPATVAGLGWPAAETAPLEALRAATVAAHPELAPAGER